MDDVTTIHRDLLLNGGHLTVVISPDSTAEQEANRLQASLSQHCGNTLEISIGSVDSAGSPTVRVRPIWQVMGPWSLFWDRLIDDTMRIAPEGLGGHLRPGHIRALGDCVAWSGIVVSGGTDSTASTSLQAWLQAHLTPDSYERTIPWMDGRASEVTFRCADGSPDPDAIRLFAGGFRPTATWLRLTIVDRDGGRLKRPLVKRYAHPGFCLRKPKGSTSALLAQLAQVLRHNLIRPTLAWAMSSTASRAQVRLPHPGDIAARLDDDLLDLVVALVDGSRGAGVTVSLPVDAIPDPDHVVDQVNRLLRGSDFIAEPHEVPTSSASFHLRRCTDQERIFQGVLDPSDPNSPLKPHRQLEYVHVRRLPSMPAENHAPVQS